MAARYIVPALALAGRAIAQSSSCSAETTTISSAADATALAACETFSGSVAVATGVAGNIALDGVQSITGSLIADGAADLTALSSTSLESIGESFNLNGLTIMSSLNFPKLTDVGSIDWMALDAIQGLSFTTGIQTADEVSIQNCGQLNSLEGINLQVADKIFIANNPYLDDIQMQLGNVTTSLTIQFNGKNVSAIFPNLIWAKNITLSGVTNASFDSLEYVNGSVGFINNKFETLEAANLTTIEGTLNFQNNDNLVNISMPLLKTVSGGLVVANNTDLDSIDFPAVETVGDLRFNGNFSEVSLDALKDVRGALTVKSNQDITDICSHFKEIKSDVIQGKLTCDGNSKTTESGSSTTSGSSSSSTASGAASGVYIPSAASGFVGVVAVIFGLL